MTEFHELLGTNPAIPVYKYGLLDENMNVFQVGRNEKDRVSLLFNDVLHDSWVWRSGRNVDLHTAKDRVREYPWYGLHA